MFGLLWGVPAMALPSGYTELTYVEMNAGSYLQTDLVPTYDSKIEMDFQTTTTIGTPNTYLGGSTGSSDGMRFAHISNKTFRINAFGDTRDSTATVANNTRYKFVFDNNTLTLTSGGSNVYANTFTGTDVATIPLAINGYNVNGTVQQSGEGIYLYSFKAWNAQGELVANYIPAKQGNTVGFYDTVSQSFKTATSGTFTAGTELDSCRNLFDENSAILANGWVLNVADSVLKRQSDGYTWAIPCAPNTTYTVSHDAQNPNTVLRIAYGTMQDLSFTSGTADQSVYSVQNGSVVGNYRTATITTGANATYLFVQLGATNQATAKQSTQLETGSTVTRYTPYDSACNTVANSGPIQSVTVYGLTELNGTPSPTNPATIQTNNGVLKVYKNLVTNTFQGNIDASGKILSVSNTWYINIVPVTPGATYTGSPVKVYAFYTTLPTIGSVSYNNSRVVIADQGTQTITVPNDPTIKYLAFRSDNEPTAVCVLGNDISNLNKTYTDGTVETITDSANHTANVATLLGVGDYKDSQVIGTGAITRNVGIKVLDGTENWDLATYWGTHAFSLPRFDGGSGIVPLICSHNTNYAGSSAVALNNQCTMRGSSFILSNNDYTNTSATDFKQWLADQYNAGTPVIVVYPLASSTTESVTAQTLSTAPVSNATGGVNGMTIRTVLTSGAEFIETIADKIKIATNKFTNAAFSTLVSGLTDAINTIKDVVANTINQTAAVASLQSGKQTMPDSTATNGTCPDYKQCLLVEDSSGDPHWYVISDPFRDFVAPILANNVNATSSTSQNGVPSTYTQVEYIQSERGAYIDTGITYGKFVHDIQFIIDGQRNLQGNGISDSMFWEATDADRFKFSSASNGYILGNPANRNIVEFYMSSSEASLTIGNNTITHAHGSVNNKTYLLFALNGSTTYSALAKLYSLKVYNNSDVLVQDLVPVQTVVNGQTVVGMYDTVTGNFLTNSGTGDFVAGPTVPNQKAEWSATWAAGNNNGVVAGTVYGTTNCNGMTGTLSNSIATAEQMASNNWSTYGTACWCKASGVIVDGERTDKTNDVYYRVSTGGNCAVICPGYCASYAKTNNGVRQGLFGQ